MKFGKLTVVRLLEVGSNEYPGGLWECFCECGNTCRINGRKIGHSGTKTCGCSKLKFTEHYMIGRRFNKLVVIECVEQSKGQNNKGGLWKCRCDCGKVVIVKGYSLRCSDGRKSCNCLKAEKIFEYFESTGTYSPDKLIGKRYGTLTVIGCKSAPTSENNYGEWVCKCDCGQQFIRTGIQLWKIKGHGFSHRKCAITSSHFGTSDRKSIITIKSQYRHHKRGAMIKERTFLSEEEWKSIVFKPCAYCGDIDTRNCMTGNARSRNNIYFEMYAVKMNGVDRVDSSKGYSIENCVPCCGKCNTMKMNLSLEEFTSKIKSVYEHFVKPLL